MVFDSREVRHTWRFHTFCRLNSLMSVSVTFNMVIILYKSMYSMVYRICC